MGTKGKRIAAWAIFIVIAIIAISVSYNNGYSAKVDSKAVAALTKTKISKNSELNKINSKIASQSKYESQLNNYIANKKKLDAEIKASSNKLKSANKMLKYVTRKIIKTLAKPITIPAGEYTVGSDVNPGRYSVDGSSNFVVYDSSGNLLINTVLGNSGIGVGTYTCTLSKGDTIKTESRTTFTLVK